MPLNQAYIDFRNERLHYACTGKGSKIVLAFHGFGQSKAHLHSLANQLSNEYTVYAFDLFFHGHSLWKQKDAPLTKEFWIEMMNHFLEKNNIEKFSLLGFSMGGKFVLATLEGFPERVTELIFIAPDGIKTNIWYNLATSPGLTQSFFKKLVVDPNSFKNLAYTFNKLKIVDKGVVRFAQTQMSSREKRIRVYYAWTVFKELRFDMDYIAHLLNAYRTPTYIFLGKYDRVITRKSIDSLLNKLYHCKLTVLETSHNRLIEEVANYYAAHRAWA